MIEPAPIYSRNDDTIPLMVKMQGNGILKKIQDDYQYWDRVKYKAKDCPPNELWNAVKLYRYIRSENVKFGNYTFNYMITEYMHRAFGCANLAWSSS